MPMEKSVLRTVLFSVFLGFGYGQVIQQYFNQERDFYAFRVFAEAPISVTSDLTLSNGSDTAPCLQPNFCYQVMSVKRLALIQSQMYSGEAAAIFFPSDGSLSPVAFSFVLKEGTSPHLPSDVHLLKEYLIPPRIIQTHLLLFSNDIGNVQTVGEIVGPSEPWSLSKLKLKTFSNQPLGSRVVYISGRMETQSFWMTLKFPSLPDFTIKFIPVSKIAYPPSPPVWINWRNLKITNTLVQSFGPRTTAISCALLYFLMVKAFVF